MTELRIPLGNPFDRIAQLGFGCCPMGQHGWGEVDERDLITAVHVALDMGVTLFDTADIYGLGVSEVTLGKALRGRRREATIATKFGVRQNAGRTFYDTSANWIREAVDASLRRLDTDYIDLYQMHYWDGKTPFAEITAVLDDLRRCGKIRHYGITNSDPLAFVNCCADIQTFSCHYSLVDRSDEKRILEAQDQLETYFLSWGSLSQGLLSGKIRSVEQLDANDRRRRKAYANFHGARLEAIQDVVGHLATIAAEIGVTSLTQLALRWVVDRIPRAIPLVGIKRPEQIRDAAGMLAIKLDTGVLRRLDELTVPFIKADSI